MSQSRDVTERDNRWHSGLGGVGRSLFVVAILVAVGLHFERSTIALALSAALLATVLLYRLRRD